MMTGAPNMSVDELFTLSPFKLSVRRHQSQTSGDMMQARKVPGP